MQFRLQLTQGARHTLAELQQRDPKKYKKVLKTLGLMETDLRHPGLKTHKYESLRGPGGAEVFEAYVENRTPGAFRVFWCYGPVQGILTVLAITPHP